MDKLSAIRGPAWNHAYPIHPSSAAIGFEPAYGNAVSASAQIEWELPQMRAIPQRADIRID
ncbi:hypothetical protein [Cupriavidus sp. PET2-C1]